MATDWHPADGFDTLVLRLFTGAAYASSAGYKMNDIDIVDIGLLLIKRCGMYAEEYKAWIAREAIRPQLVETFYTFKTFWADKITLVNQTAIPVGLHCYGMNAISVINNDDASVISYGESLANFYAAYAAMQESVKMQGTTITALQAQVAAMQQYCMALQGQPPPAIYMPPRAPPNNNRRGSSRRGGNRGNPTGYQPPGGMPNARAPTPYKRFKIGITVTPTAATLTTITQARPVPTPILRTIDMPPTKTP
jgi:hypothetical protein